MLPAQPGANEDPHIGQPGEQESGSYFQIFHRFVPSGPSHSTLCLVLWSANFAFARIFIEMLCVLLFKLILIHLTNHLLRPRAQNGSYVTNDGVYYVAHEVQNTIPASYLILYYKYNLSSHLYLANEKMGSEQGRNLIKSHS